MKYNNQTVSILTDLHVEVLSILLREQKKLDNEMVMVLFAGLTCFLADFDEENISNAVELFGHHCGRFLGVATSTPELVN